VQLDLDAALQRANALRVESEDPRRGTAGGGPATAID